MHLMKHERHLVRHRRCLAMREHRHRRCLAMGEHRHKRCLAMGEHRHEMEHQSRLERK
jgi:hypothetical protein